MTTINPTDKTSVAGETPALEVVGISKVYPGIKALDDVSFQLMPGEVHVLFGENGAGKSTLISILAGSNQATSGDILFHGKPVSIHNVHEARELGIGAVFQEFSLIPQMTVEENLFLGAEVTKSGLLRKRYLREEAIAILKKLDFQLDPQQRVDRLTRAEQQVVEIAKAFRTKLSVLILDEPTASLTQHETEHLFRLVRELKQQGVGIVYITHRMAEISEIGDRITVLRDGKFIKTVDAKTTSEDELVRLMTGREVGHVFPEIPHNQGDKVLETQSLATHDGSVQDVSIEVHRGEIVGLAGLIGSGKSEVMQACFGAKPVKVGNVLLHGKDFTHKSPGDMIENGMLYLPADRRTEGLMMMRSGRENMSLAALRLEPFSNGYLLNIAAEKKAANALAKKLHISPPNIEWRPEQYSGGNQQKIMLAKSLSRSFDVIVFDEPTVGVDVGTRAAIYGFIAELCENGIAVVIVSSDLPEVLNISHRVYVFYKGRVQAELTGKEITEENTLAHFFDRKVA